MGEEEKGERITISTQPPIPTRELVLQKLRDCFPDAQGAARALEVLDTYGGESWHGERERVQLAILKGCRGEFDTLVAGVEIACRDYRDVLAGSEYPEEFKTWKKLPEEQMKAIRDRDREQYEKWLGERKK